MKSTKGWWAGVFLLCLGASATARAEDDLFIGETPLSQLLKHLRSDSRGSQLRAGQALSKASPEQQPLIVPHLVPLLKSDRENDRFVAAQTLGNYGSASRPVATELLPLLEGTQFERNRAAAAKALGQILKDAPPSEAVEKVTQALLKTFDDRYSDVRREAVTALGMIGPAAKTCIPQLTKPLTTGQNIATEEGLVRRAAAWACGRMGPLAAEHVDRLVSMMQAEGDWAPEYVEALGLIGPVNENVAKNIVDKIETTDANAEGIAVPDPAGRFRVKAFAALGRFGPQAECAVSFTKRFLSKPPGGEDTLGVLLAIEAVRLIQAIGPRAKDALPQIEALATYPPRNELCRVLGAEARKTAALLGSPLPLSKEKTGAEKR